MDKKKRTRELIVFAVIVLALLAGCLLTPSGGESEPIQEVMRDAVLHEQNKVSLFGLIEVNPGLISAYIVTGILIVFALVCRLFVIPKFKYVPGRFQLVLEQIVGMFDGLAEGSSPHRNKFLRAYIFTAGVYIFVSTLFELLGIQVVTTSGHAVSLPAPLSDINGAIALGVMSYGVILFGGLIAAGVRGFLHALKDFSLPISMSFRLFGALLSGALVTELVYYYAALSYVLPVIVGVTFTVSVTLLSLSLSFAARAGMVQIISAHSSIISAANFFIVFMANLPLSSGSRFAAGFFYLLGLGLLLVLFGRFAVERRHQHR